MSAAYAFARRHLPPGGTPLLLAVSGGCDSIALLHWLHALGEHPLVVAHLDHGLRADSVDDAAFVAERCAALKVVCHRRRVEVAALAAAWGCGLEEAGRLARYDWFAELMQAQGIAWLCTAHHRDDQLETVLGNLLRGAGPIGAGGMQTQRQLAGGGHLLRPWLEVGREEIRDYARQHGLAWREDPSNADTRFRRNALRHAVIPTFERGCPGFGAALLAWSRGERAAVVPLRERITAVLADRDELPVEAWSGRSRDERLLLWRELCVRLGCRLSRRTLGRLDDLACGASGRCLHLGDLLIARRGDRLQWERLSADDDAAVTGLPVAPIEPCAPRRIAEVWRACIDADAVHGELRWRWPLPGERWRSLGAPGSRPLRRWLGERGLPRERRARQPVLADDAGVVWVPGFTIAERVRIRPQSVSALDLRCEPDLPGAERSQALPA